MVFIQNVNVLNCHSEKKSIFKTSHFNNPFLTITIVSTIILQIIMSELNVTSAFLGVVPLPIWTIIKLLLLSFIIIAVYEIYKLIYKLKNKE